MHFDAGEEEKRSILLCGHRGRLHSLAKKGRLAYSCADTLVMGDLLTAVGPDAVGTNGPVNDNKEPAWRVAGQKEDFTFGQLLLDGAAGNGGEFVIFKRMEEGR